MIESPVMAATLPRRRQVETFANALRIAIYDRNLEEREKIVYCYDADIIVPVVLGILDREHSHVRVNQQQLLVRALLYTGHFGPVGILRPHAFELEQTLRNLPELGDEGERRTFSAQVQQFLTAHGLHETVRRLHSVSQDSSLESAERIRRFLQELQGAAPSAFAALVIAQGTWKQRLRHCWDRLALRPTGPTINTLLQSEYLRHFHKMVGDQRERDSARLSLSTFRDALALASLCEFVRVHDAGGDVPRVRFYSDTVVLRIAFDDRAVRERLSYARSQEDEEPGQLCIVRDEHYLTMRACFEALRHKDAVNSGNPAPQVTLADLRDLDRDLREILSCDDRELERALTERTLRGKPLGCVVEDFASLAFLKTIWVNYNPPEAITALIPHWTDILCVTRQQDTAQQLQDNISEISDELRQLVEELGSWHAHFRRIRSAAQKTVRRTYADRVVPDPKRDLGMIRWGIDLQEEKWREIEQVVARLIEPEEEEFSLACARIALDVDRVEDPQQCALTCAALWLLDEYDWITRIIDRLEKASGSVPHWLELMRAAARVRTRTPVQVEEIQALIEALEGHARGLTGRTLGLFLLGLGYVLYYAWYFEKGGVSTKQTVAEIADQWGVTSLKKVLEARSLFENWTLERAFAANHCVYVGAEIGRPWDEIRPCFDELMSFRGMQGIWHYRFADTCAWVHYHEARKVWSTERRRGLSLDQRNRVVARLTMAQHLLDEAHPDFGDPEIAEHRMKVGQLRAEVGCT